MKFNLLEDNKDIDDLLKYLEKKIISLRKNNKIDQEDKNLIEEIYKDEINPWMAKYHLLNVEIDNTKEERLKNILLDLINILNKI